MAAAASSAAQPLAIATPRAEPSGDSGRDADRIPPRRPPGGVRLRKAAAAAAARELRACAVGMAGSSPEVPAAPGDCGGDGTGQTGVPPPCPEPAFQEQRALHRLGSSGVVVVVVVGVGAEGIRQPTPRPAHGG